MAKKTASIAMYSYILVIGFLFSGAFCQNRSTFENSTEWRAIYITPDGDSNSQVSCPVDHCYHLQDVVSNSPYFFDSYTTLELLPGTYDITEKVGQLVLVNAKNFTLKGSSPNVTITCQPGATLGLTIIQSQNVEISNIQISHCSAKLQLEDSNSELLTTYNKKLEEYLKHNLSSCDINAYSYPACYTFLASFRNKNVTIHETAILYSKGVGIFSLDSRDLDISKSLLAYNQINCINFVLDDTYTDTAFYMSQSQIEFGQTKFYSFMFASGLNLFVHVYDKIHKIQLTNVTLTNNRGAHGNFYMAIDTQSTSFHREDLNVNIQITNMSSIQTKIASPGIVIKYKIDLKDIIKNGRSSLPHFPGLFERTYFDDIPYYYSLFDRCDGYSSPFDLDCYQWSWNYGHTQSRRLNYWQKRVAIVLQNIYLIGSCVTIKDSELSIEKYSWFRFEMNNITISESKCPVAISVVNSDIHNYVRLSDLTIINSHNNILSVNVIGSYGSKLVLTGNTSFLTNQGSVSLISGTIEFKDFVLISGNTAHKYESVFQVSDSCRVYFKGETMFFGNTGRQGGAISAYSSNIDFAGNVSFIGNSADNGGAISLKEGAVINLKGDTDMIFKENVADMYGGAMYIEDTGFWVRRRVRCFVSISYFKNGYYSIELENNTAGIAGAALFGGWIDLCKMKNGKKSSDIFEFKSENSIASNPTRVCRCTNSTLNKYEAEARIEAFPGQTFEIDVVAVGQRFGVIPASVRAETGINVIDQLQKLQDTEDHCTKLKFTVRSSNRNETMQLSIDGQTVPQWINNETIPNELLQFKVFITLEDCPLGFEFDSRRNICLCHHYLDYNGVQCNFTTYKINRNAQQWIGVLIPTKTVVIHQHCPYDYCKPYALSLNLSTPNDQCSSSRSGILCGSCQPGLSQVLGTSNCKKCSNLSLLLTFVFALAGVLLVAGLMVLNITVSTGTINGLIFYANIVRANAATFFPDKTANTFLSWFIAWLNLDVGIEMCFYDGLDAYSKTWLQFAFPLYIWFLVALIIVSSKYSKRAANTFGVNAVQVLATLFLLSYAKLLRLTITVFQPTHLLDNHKVWHYDGNLAYLGKQHILLMLVALLVFMVFFIPYTLIIFGIQWLQIFSHYKLFRWVNKLKPLFDAYTGPYKDKHRYWTGLLLLVRIGLFIVFSTNTSGDPAINLLAIIVVIICLFAYLAIFGGIYKNRLLNLLEYSSLLNLVILSVTMLYTTSVDKPNHVLSKVSISIALCTTLLVVAYHSSVVILKALKIDAKVKAIWRSNNKGEKQPTENDDEMQQYDAKLNPQVTHSVIELKEPLLEY